MSSKRHCNSPANRLPDFKSLAQNPAMPSSAHLALAQHFFLDALDLMFRYRTHWESQPRVSSRVKSFIDLLMACECMLKVQCILGCINTPLVDTYIAIKKNGHSIGKLSDSAQKFFPMPAHARAKRQFSQFSVGLRYSVDAHQYFFPHPGTGRGKPHLYGSTLGSTVWMKESEAIVDEFIAWGVNQFAGEVTSDIEKILEDEELLWSAIVPSQRSG